jgi:hypothetical protein
VKLENSVPEWERAVLPGIESEPFASMIAARLLVTVIVAETAQDGMNKLAPSSAVNAREAGFRIFPDISHTADVFE